jgi:mannose-6-phosphate isomerase-like protein (cupin superfamily)
MRLDVLTTNAIGSLRTDQDQREPAVVKIYRADSTPERMLLEGVTTRPLVSSTGSDQAGVAGVPQGRVEWLRLEPGARLVLERRPGEERWFFVLAGRGQVSPGSGKDREGGELKLVPGGLLWLDESDRIEVHNSGGEPLELVEVRAHDPE